MYEKNRGLVDRGIRIVAAAALAYLYFAQVVTGGWGMAILVAGGVLLATSVVGFCPLYTLFGWKTCRHSKT